LIACLSLFAATLTAQAPGRVTALDPLHQFNNSLEALVKHVSPSVVQVLATGYGAELATHPPLGVNADKSL
jgi:hypothetical protein